MKKFKIILLLLFLSSASFAQVDSVYTGIVPGKVKPRKAERNDEWLEKCTYGGNFQIWLGDVKYVFLSPTIGYMPVKKLNLAVGMVYNYISIDHGAYGKYEQSVYGTHSYARFMVTDGFFLQAQYDKLRQPNPDYNTTIKGTAKKLWIDYALVGGGFMQSLGDKAALTFSLMYNLTPSALSIYPTRFVAQLGFTGKFR